MAHRFRFQLAAAIVLGAAMVQSASADQPTQSGPGWTYFRLGNPKDVKTTTIPGIVFEGGGKDVDDAYHWMCRRGGNGDFLVIRVTGTDAYNKYIHRFCPAINSVSTLIITTRHGADQPFVRNTMAHAEALFIAGGDQGDYVKLWENTSVNRVINRLARNGVPVGGTSAGNAILAQFAYSALTGGSTRSKKALADPFDPTITITAGFLRVNPLLRDRITDDHFVTRDRMGRLVAFLARIAVGRGTHIARAIATDENTAFLMDSNGKGRIAGHGTAYFISAPGVPEVCEPGKPLTYENLQVYRIAKGGTFDIRTWTGTGGTAYTVSATNGVMSSTQPGGSLY
jgi:cyanophycinase